MVLLTLNFFNLNKNPDFSFIFN